MGFVVTKRCREIYPAQFGICRQSPILRQYNLSIRQKAGLRRKYLGNQKTYRICIARNASLLHGKRPVHRHCRFRIFRLGRPLPQMPCQPTATSYQMDGSFRHRTLSREIVSFPLFGRTTIGSSGTGIRKRT